MLEMNNQHQDKREGLTSIIYLFLKIMALISVQDSLENDLFSQDDVNH